MTVSHWQSGRKSVAVYVDGTVVPDLDAHGQPVLDDDVLILVNGSPRPVTFTIPQVGKRCSWHTEVDSFDLGADITKPGTAGATDPVGTPGTVRTGPPAGPAHIGAGDHLTVRQRSLVLLLAPQSGTGAAHQPARARL
jgi:glycogen operon protein